MNKEYIKEVYKNDEVELEVKIDLDYESVWLNQDDLAKLYNLDRSVIGKYIRNTTYKSDRCWANFAQHLPDGRVFQKKHYSLEVIEKIGYKINAYVTKNFINFSNNLLNELRNKSSEKWLPIEVFSDGDVRLEVSVSPNEDTVWLSQNQISILYSISKSNTSEHINNILNDGELDNSVVRFFRTTASDGKEYNIRKYNLDMILAIGYRVNSKIGMIFRKWTTNIIKRYLMKGFVIDERRVTQYKDNYKDLMTSVISINNKVDNLDKRVATLEDKNQDNKESIFFNGEFYDAHSKIIEIIKKANSKIVLIDNYVGKETLDILSYKNDNVIITIITNKEYIESVLNETTLNKFNKQYGKINIIYSNSFHDRFLIIDNIKLYHVGASLKDIGKKCFAISELNNDILKYLFSQLHKLNP